MNAAATSGAERHLRAPTSSTPSPAPFRRTRIPMGGVIACRSRTPCQRRSVRARAHPNQRTPAVSQPEHADLRAIVSPAPSPGGEPGIDTPTEQWLLFDGAPTFTSTPSHRLSPVSTRLRGSFEVSGFGRSHEKRLSTVTALRPWDLASATTLRSVGRQGIPDAATNVNAGRTVGHRWAVLLAASGQLPDRHWAGSRGRRHTSRPRRSRQAITRRLPRSRSGSMQPTTGRRPRRRGGSGTACLLRSARSARPVPEVSAGRS